VLALLTGGAGVTARSAIGRIVGEGGLAAVAAEIFVAVAEFRRALQIARGVAARPLRVRWRDAGTARPAGIGVARRGRANRAACAAVLVVGVEPHTVVATLREAARAPARASPADHTVGAHVSACAAVRGIASDRGLAAVALEAVAVCMRWFACQSALPFAADPGPGGQGRSRQAGRVAATAVPDVAREVDGAETRPPFAGREGRWALGLDAGRARRAVAREDALLGHRAVDRPRARRLDRKRHDGSGEDERRPQDSGLASGPPGVAGCRPVSSWAIVHRGR